MGRGGLAAAVLVVLLMFALLVWQLLLVLAVAIEIQFQCCADLLRTVIASLTTNLCTFSICKGSLFGRFWVPTLLSPMLDKAAKKHDQNAPWC